MFPAKTCASEARIRDAAARLNAEELHQKATALRAERDKLLAASGRAGEGSRAPAAVCFRRAAAGPPGGAEAPAADLVKAPEPALEQMQRSCPETLAWEHASPGSCTGSPTLRRTPQRGMDGLPRAGPEELPALEVPVRERLEQIARSGTRLKTELPRSRRHPDGSRNSLWTTSWPSATGRRS